MYGRKVPVEPTELEPYQKLHLERLQRGVMLYRDQSGVSAECGHCIEMITVKINIDIYWIQQF